MSVEYICDGCGLRAKAITYDMRDWFKPRDWFQRSDKDGIQDACSRECIEKISVKTGKTRAVSPW